MGKLFSKLTALVVYLCVGTVIAQGIGVGYSWSKGYLTRDKLEEMLAIARQTDAESEPEPATEKKEETSEQPSFDDREQARAIQSRQFELREQALRSGLEQIRYEQRRLIDEKEAYERIRAAFDKHLENLREGALAQGRAHVRSIWENVRPKEAKQQILQMLDNGELTEVVAILNEMPIAKRAKICAEFSKTEEDVKKLDEILRLIREGVPETPLIDDTRQALQDTDPGTR